jgi:hypothetical protein
MRDATTEASPTGLDGPSVPGAAAIDWEAIASQWRRREDRELRSVLRQRGMAAALDEVVGPLSNEAVSLDVTSKAVECLLAAAGDDPLDRALVASFVYLRALIVWEMSVDYETIHNLGHALGAAFRVDADQGADPDRPNDPFDRCADAAVRLALTLEYQLELENAMLCSCSDTMAGLASDPVALARQAKVMLGGLDDGPAAEHARLLFSDADAIETHISAIGVAADEASRLLRGERDGPSLESALETCRAAEDHLATDVLGSEVRVNRQALERLVDVAAEPQLRLERGRVTFIYPFAIPEVEPDRLVDRLLDDTLPAEVRTPAGGFGGVDASVPERVTLSDSWRRDLALHQRYEVISLTLSELTVTTVRGEVLAPLQPTVELSSLGNHAVKVILDIADASPHEVDRHLRRLGKHIGSETVELADPSEAAGDDAPSWDQIIAFATDVVIDVRAFARAQLDVPDDDQERDADIDLLPTAHVLLTCKRLVVDALDDTTRLAVPSDLEELSGGAAFLLPRRNLAASIADWVRFEPPPIDNVLAGIGRVDDLMHRTAGTTVIWMPGVPDWMVSIYEEMAVFAAATPGVLAAWADRIGQVVHTQASDLSDAVEQRDLAPMLSRVERLARLNSTVYSLLSRLKAANLCNSEDKRETLDCLLEASGFTELEDGLKEHLTSLSAHQQLLSAEASKLIEQAEAETRRVQRRRQRLIEGIVMLLAVTGIAEVYGWANTSFSLADVPWVRFVQLGLLLAFATAVLLLWQRDDHDH